MDYRQKCWELHVAYNKGNDGSITDLTPMIETLKQIIHEVLQDTLQQPPHTTVSIQIGNSDNKLTQQEWADYCTHVHRTINDTCTTIHYNGGSNWNAPWQNACWVAEIPTNKLPTLKQQLTHTRTTYHQDSIAIINGTTEFI